MKKTIGLVTALAVILGTSSVCFADAATTQGVVNSINLSDALNRVEKNDSNIKILDSSIQLYEKLYEDDLADSKSPDYNSEPVTLKKQQLLNWKNSLNTLNDAKYQRDESLNIAKYDTERQYLSILTLQESIKNIQTQVDNINKKIDVDKLKVSLGQLTDSTLKQDQTEKEQYLSSLNNAQFSLQSAFLTLKQHIGVNLDTDISLYPTKKDFVKFDDSNIEKRITRAVDFSYDVDSIANQISTTTIELNIDKQYGSSYKKQIKSVELDINDLNNKLEDTRLDKEITLWKSYYNLKNMEDTIEVDKANLETAQLALNITEAKFKAGLVDDLQENDDKVSLETQKVKLQQDINEYMISVESFKNDLGEIK